MFTAMIKFENKLVKKNGAEPAGGGGGTTSSAFDMKQIMEDSAKQMVESKKITQPAKNEDSVAKQG